MSETEILNRLNEYEAGDGDNIWQDVIYGVDGYDDGASEMLDRGQSDIFAAAGVVYRRDAARGAWYVDESIVPPVWEVADEDILALRDEAQAAGDRETVEDCGLALLELEPQHTDVLAARNRARSRIQTIIRETRTEAAWS